MDFLDKEDPELDIGSSSCDVSGFLNGLSRMRKSLCEAASEGQGLSA